MGAGKPTIKIFPSRKSRSLFPRLTEKYPSFRQAVVSLAWQQHSYVCEEALNSLAVWYVVVQWYYGSPGTATLTCGIAWRHEELARAGTIHLKCDRNWMLS